jgi:hypothetical protein
MKQTRFTRFVALLLVLAVFTSHVAPAHAAAPSRNPLGQAWDLWYNSPRLVKALILAGLCFGAPAVLGPLGLLGVAEAAWIATMAWQMAAPFVFLLTLALTSGNYVMPTRPEPPPPSPGRDRSNQIPQGALLGISPQR